MIRVEVLEIRENFPVQDEAYALLRGEDGRYAFAWGPTYPYADDVPAESVLDGESGIEWHDTEDAARNAMIAAMEACGDIGLPQLGGYQAVAEILGCTRGAVYDRWKRMQSPRSRTDFPRPKAMNGDAPLWDLAEVRRWAERNERKS